MVLSWAARIRCGTRARPSLASVYRVNGNGGLGSRYVAARASNSAGVRPALVDWPQLLAREACSAARLRPSASCAAAASAAFASCRGLVPFALRPCPPLVGGWGGRLRPAERATLAGWLARVELVLHRPLHRGLWRPLCRAVRRPVPRAGVGPSAWPPSLASWRRRATLSEAGRNQASKARSTTRPSPSRSPTAVMASQGPSVGLEPPRRRGLVRGQSSAGSPRLEQQRQIQTNGHHRLSWVTE